jgi:hypothetical protein
MLRCVALTAALVALVAPAAAQAPRNFPGTALRGEIVVTQPPELLLNRQPARLAPGARIRGTDNLLQLSGALVGQRLLVNYNLDLQGEVLNVWVLTASEAARKPWPATLAEAQGWSFDVAAQSWSRP